MTDKTPDEKQQGNEQPEDPFANVPLKKTGDAEKNGFGLILVFLLVILGLLFSILSPLPAIMIGYLPQSLVAKVVDDVHKQIIIIDTPTKFEQPVKLPLKKPLPVFGLKTGLCFTFKSDAFKHQDNKVNLLDLQNKIKQTPFVEIVTRDEEKQEYTLNDIIVERGIDEKRKAIISICYEFGTQYSIIPNEVLEIYLRPNEVFSVEKIIWHTTKTIL